MLSEIKIIKNALEALGFISLNLDEFIKRISNKNEKQNKFTYNA